MAWNWLCMSNDSPFIYRKKTYLIEFCWQNSLLILFLDENKWVCHFDCIQHHVYVKFNLFSVNLLLEKHSNQQIHLRMNWPLNVATAIVLTKIFCKSLINLYFNKFSLIRSAFICSLQTHKHKRNETKQYKEPW